MVTKEIVKYVLKPELRNVATILNTPPLPAARKILGGREVLFLPREEHNCMFDTDKVLRTARSFANQ
jgi:hypothetical protein